MTLERERNILAKPRAQAARTPQAAIHSNMDEPSRTDTASTVTLLCCFDLQVRRDACQALAVLAASLQFRTLPPLEGQLQQAEPVELVLTPAVELLITQKPNVVQVRPLQCAACILGTFWQHSCVRTHRSHPALPCVCRCWKMCAMTRLQQYAPLQQQLWLSSQLCQIPRLLTMPRRLGGLTRAKPALVIVLASSAKPTPKEAPAAAAQARLAGAAANMVQYTLSTIGTGQCLCLLVCLNLK